MNNFYLFIYLFILSFFFQEKEDASDAETADADFEEDFEANELKVLNTLKFIGK